MSYKLKIGLTGGIGAGKSEVCRHLAQWGAAVIDTDRIAHDLTQANGAAISEIKKSFGTQAISHGGALNRAWMRALIFSDASARVQLEMLLHPLISQKAVEMADNLPGHYQVFVVPLLVETKNWYDRVDRVCVVDCDPYTQIQRVKMRPGLTISTIWRIMAVQAMREVRLAAANDVILNNALTSPIKLKTCIEFLHHRWLKIAHTGRLHLKQ